MHVIFDEFNDFDDKRMENNDKDKQHYNFDINKNGQDILTTSSQDPLRCWKIVKYHPQDQIIGNFRMESEQDNFLKKIQTIWHFLSVELKSTNELGERLKYNF